MRGGPYMTTAPLWMEGIGTMDKAWTTPPVPCHARTLRRIRSVDDGPRVEQARQSECQRSTSRFTMLPDGRSQRFPGRCPRACAGSTARHLRRIQQPDAPPALRQQPRPRHCDLGLSVRVREAARRRTATLPAVEPKTRTRPVQDHRRNPAATLPVVLARVQQPFGNACIVMRPCGVGRLAIIG